MTVISIGGRLDRAKLERLADGLAAAVAISLPWSTSATGILTALWLIALIPTLSFSELRREILAPAGGLPVLLALLGILGMAWADVSLAERWHGLDSFLKLMLIPLLLAQFRRSDRAEWVFGGYALSCVVLLLVSFGQTLWPGSPLLLSPDPGVPVKSAATQSGEFVTCIFGFLFLGADAFVQRRWAWLSGLTAVILAMLVNIVFVATGRTALVVILVLLVLFAARRLSARGIMLISAGAVAFGALAWLSSPYLRDRTEQIWTDLKKTETTGQATSSGERAEFYKKSIAFIHDAPVIGHGTGSIHTLFVRSAAGPDAIGAGSTNPHNQTFAVAIQLGFLGAAMLWAMWIAHLMMFRGGGLPEWIGFVLVVQNIVGSLFNSHLFDFVQGWTYVIGVGVAGGVALKNRAAKRGGS